MPKKSAAKKATTKKTSSKVSKTVSKVQKSTPKPTTVSESPTKVNSSNSWWWIIILILVFLIAIPLISRGVNNSTDSNNDTSSMVQGGYDTEINMKNFEFSQTAIEAQRGQTLKIKVNNEQGAHNFAVPELKINSGVLKEGESKVVEITIPEDAPNTYEFASTFDNNDQLGMVGTIVIGE